MKRTLPLIVPIALFISAACLVPSTFATIPPTLALAATDSGDNVQITVTGDPNVSVLLSYTVAGSGPQIYSLGTTNGSGSFTTVVSSATLNLTSGTLVTAILNGTGGPMSPTVAWPAVTSANALALSQNAVVVSVGSSATLTASNASSALYQSNNSNPSIANVSFSGAQITISGNVAGSTTVTICQVGNTTSCPSVYVTVGQAGTGQLSFSQSSVSVVSGQNLPVTMTGGNGSYTLVNNSNASVIQASISGSVLTLSTGATTGSSSLTICSTDMSTCGIVIATAGSTSSVAVSFSSSAPVVSAGQNTTVNVYGPSGVQFYVSSNSNPSIVQANLSGTTLTLSGIAAGSSSISVCASTVPTGTCASLTVTVQSITGGGNLTLSQNTISVLTGQNIPITISGGDQPYFVSGGTSSISQETLSGNTLTVYGIAAGTSVANICSSGGGCIPLTVTVNSTGTSSATFSMSQTSVSLTSNQSTTISLYGSGSYYLSGNTGPSVASVAISGSSAVVTGLSSGMTNATICASGGPCATLAITVNATTSSSTSTATPAVLGASVSPAYTFTKYLTPGSSGAEVTALQQLLVAQGLLSATPNGNYGPQTEAAVIKFQAAHGLSQLGVVGPTTRAALNQIETANASGSNSTAAVGEVSAMTLSQLQAAVQSLQAQLTQILNRITQLGG